MAQKKEAALPEAVVVATAVVAVDLLARNDDYDDDAADENCHDANVIAVEAEECSLVLADLVLTCADAVPVEAAVAFVVVA